MPWTLPATWTAGQLVLASDLNTWLRDNMLWLVGTAGVITQIASAVGTTSSVTTTSTSLVALADPVISLTTLAGSNVVAIFNGNFQCTSLGAGMTFNIAMDGNSGANVSVLIHAKVANYNESVALVAMFPAVTAAAHSFQAQWSTTAGTLKRDTVGSNLVLVEFRR